MLKNLYPRNIALDTYSVEEEMTSLTHKAAEDALEKFGETPKNVLHYRYLNITGGFDGNRVICDPNKAKELSNQFDSDIRQLFFVTVADYNELMGKNEALSDGEAILYTSRGNFKYDTITLDEYGTFEIKAIADDFAGNGTDAMIDIKRINYICTTNGTLNECHLFVFL